MFVLLLIYNIVTYLDKQFLSLLRIKMYIQLNKLFRSTVRCFVFLKNTILFLSNSLQAFLKGETQILADEAFQNAVQSYQDVFLKSERVEQMVKSGACSHIDFHNVFRNNIEKRVRFDDETLFIFYLRRYWDAEVAGLIPALTGVCCTLVVYDFLNIRENRKLGSDQYI